MKSRVLYLSLLLATTAVLASGQMNNPFSMPNAGHNGFGQTMNNLAGSVRTTAGQPVRNARVELRTMSTGQPVASGYTLPNGSFEFNNVPPGSYDLVAVLGVNEARQRVDLRQPNIGVQLILATDADANSGSGNATVSVAQLHVPDKARKLFAKAEEAMHKQKLPQAREAVAKALQVFPQYAQALTLRGILNLQDNHVDAACADLEQAIKDDYSYGMAYVALGAAYNLVNRFDDSLRVLQRGVSLSPASWQAHFEFSKALLGKGQFAAAFRQANKAAELAPVNYPAIHLVRAHALLGMKDYNQAVAELEQFLGTEPAGADSAHARETLNQVRAFMAKEK